MSRRSEIKPLSGLRPFASEFLLFHPFIQKVAQFFGLHRHVCCVEVFLRTTDALVQLRLRQLGLWQFPGLHLQPHLRARRHRNAPCQCHQRRQSDLQPARPAGQHPTTGREHHPPERRERQEGAGEINLFFNFHLGKTSLDFSFFGPCHLTSDGKGIDSQAVEPFR